MSLDQVYGPGWSRPDAEFAQPVFDKVAVSNRSSRRAVA